jgi:MFS family permease
MTVAAVAGSALVGDDVPSALLVATLLLFGIGLGVATPSVMTAGIEAAPMARVGSAAGLLSASRYVGSIASTLVLASVVSDDGSGLATLLLVSVGCLLASLAVARGLPARVAASPQLVR